jgi:hypothetical protein
MKELVPITAHVPALVRAAGDKAQARFWEFFVSNIRNPHTRPAYGRAIAESCHFENRHPCTKAGLKLLPLWTALPLQADFDLNCLAGCKHLSGVTWAKPGRPNGESARARLYSW